MHCFTLEVVTIRANTMDFENTARHILVPRKIISQLQRYQETNSYVFFLKIVISTLMVLVLIQEQKKILVTLMHVSIVSRPRTLEQCQQIKTVP